MRFVGPGPVTRLHGVLIAVEGVFRTLGGVAAPVEV